MTFRDVYGDEYWEVDRRVTDARFRTTFTEKQPTEMLPNDKEHRLVNGTAAAY